LVVTSALAARIQNLFFLAYFLGVLGYADYESDIIFFDPTYVWLSVVYRSATLLVHEIPWDLGCMILVGLDESYKHNKIKSTKSRETRAQKKNQSQSKN
jgi:hypothetical protein